MSKDNLKNMDELLDLLDSLNDNVKEFSKETKIDIPENATREDVEKILIKKFTK